MQVNKVFVHLFHRLRVLKYLQLVTEVRHVNKKYSIPVTRGIGFAHCLGYEGWLGIIMERLKTFLAPDKAFIDVGVNVGQSLLVLKSLYPRIRYVGFEPNPVCVEYARDLIQMNKIENALVYPFGLSDQTGDRHLNFYHSNADDSSASVIAGFRNTEITGRRNIALIRGDDLKEWREIMPAVIKIDVEGFELEVLTGLINVIGAHRPPIICEVLPAYSIQNSFRIERQASVRKILLDNNYIIYHIEEAGDVNLVDGFSLDANIDACNYVFMPAENDVLKAT